MPKGGLTSVEYAYYRRQARFVARQVAPPHLVDDMVAEGMASLVTSLRSFDPARQVSLGGHVLKRMRWAILDALRLIRPGSRCDSARGVFYAEVPLGAAVELSAAPSVSTDRCDLDRAIERLSPKRRKFLRAYFATGDIAQAAAAVGMTTNCGHQHYFHAVRELRKLLA